MVDDVLLVKELPESNVQADKAQRKAEIIAQTRRYQPQDVEQLLAFRKVMYGDQSVYADGAYLAWLYEQIPAPSHPNLWIYRHQEALVAHQGAIPIGLQVGKRTYQAAWTTDLMLEPSYRRQGIGSAMQRKLEAETQIMLAMEVSDAARATFLRTGWTDLGTAPLYIRPMQAQACLQQFGALASTIGRLVADPIGQAAEALLARLHRLDDFSVEIVRDLDEQQFDALWQRVAPSLPVAVRRDSAYLKWRFMAYPDANRYQLLAVYRQQQLLGYCVTRVGQRKQQVVGYLVDLIAEPNMQQVVVLHALRYLASQNVAWVYCLLHSPLLLPSQMARLGFIRRDSGWRLMYKASEQAKEAHAVLQQVSNWHLTAADSDADRPREGIVYIADEA